MNKIRPGIDLLREIDGYGDPIKKGDRFEAVYKFYYNKGDPIVFETYNSKPIPKYECLDGKDVVAWIPPAMEMSNTIYQYNGWLERQSEMIVGIYYSLLGMKTMGYRFVKIAPPFMSDSIYDGMRIKKGSIVKVEIFLLKVEKCA